MSNMFIGDVAQMTRRTKPPTHILPEQRSPLERARGAHLMAPCRSVLPPLTGGFYSYSSQDIILITLLLLQKGVLFRLAHQREAHVHKCKASCGENKRPLRTAGGSLRPAAHGARCPMKKKRYGLEREGCRKRFSARQRAKCWGRSRWMLWPAPPTISAKHPVRSRRSSASCRYLASRSPAR